MPSNRGRYNKSIGSPTPLGARSSRPMLWLQRITQIANVLAQIRSRPSPFQYAALAMSAVEIGTSIYNDTRPTENPYSRFTSEGWSVLPKLITKCVFPRVSVGRRICSDGATEGCVGHIENIEVRVVVQHSDESKAHRGATDETIIFIRNDEDGEALRKIARDQTWLDWPKGRLISAGSTLREDTAAEADTEGFVSTEFLSNLEKRVADFSKHGVRSYLLVGVPRTGKTLAALRIARAVGARSIRIVPGDPNSVREPSDADHYTAPWVLEPDVVIYDDVDRMPQDDLLAQLSGARTCSKVIIGTANSVIAMDPANLSPERFDDILEMPPVEASVLAKFLGDDPELLKLCAKWPIGFVRDLAARVKVLGRDAALAEAEALGKRIPKQDRMDTLAEIRSFGQPLRNRTLR